MRYPFAYYKLYSITKNKINIQNSKNIVNTNIDSR